MISLICGIYVYIYISFIYTNTKLIHTKNRLTAARGRGWRVEEMGECFCFMFVQLNFLKKRNEDYWTIKTGLTEVYNMKINTVKKKF